jgi:hypothetical protein
MVVVARVELVRLGKVARVMENAILHVSRHVATRTAEMMVVVELVAHAT